MNRPSPLVANGLSIPHYMLELTDPFRYSLWLEELNVPKVVTPPLLQPDIPVRPSLNWLIPHRVQTELERLSRAFGFMGPVAEVWLSVEGLLSAHSE